MNFLIDNQLSPQVAEGFREAGTLTDLGMLLAQPQTSKLKYLPNLEQ